MNVEGLPIVRNSYMWAQSGRASPVWDVASNAWDGAAGNDPTEMMQRAVGATRQNAPALVLGDAATHLIHPAVTQSVAVYHDLRGLMDRKRGEAWMTRNGPLMDARQLGFQTRPLQPLPPRVTPGEVFSELGERLGRAADTMRPTLRNAAKTAGIVGGKLGGAWQGVTGALEGAYQGLGTPTNEYQQRTGVENPIGARALGVMGDVGNATTFGAAGKLGHWLNSRVNGGNP